MRVQVSPPPPLFNINIKLKINIHVFIEFHPFGGLKARHLEVHQS